MLLKTETVVVGGKEFRVSEENWDISMKFSLLNESSKQDDWADKKQQFFAANFYNAMSACAVGEIPTLEQTLALLETEDGFVDAWYMAVSRVNPQWFTPEFLDHQPSDVVELRDGTKLQVSTVKLPSQVMRMYSLEERAFIEPLTDLPAQLFRQVYWPKLAASTVTDGGNFFSEDVARNLPSSELDKWHAAVKRRNPELFREIEAVAKELDNNKVEQAKRLKKKERKPEKL